MKVHYDKCYVAREEAFSIYIIWRILTIDLSWIWLTLSWIWLTLSWIWLNLSWIWLKVSQIQLKVSQIQLSLLTSWIWLTLSQIQLKFFYSVSKVYVEMSIICSQHCWLSSIMCYKWHFKYAVNYTLFNYKFLFVGLFLCWKLIRLFNDISNKITIGFLVFSL